MIFIFGNGVKDIIKPYLTKDSIERVDFLLSIFGNPDFLRKASTVDTFASVAMVLAYYLQET